MYIYVIMPVASDPEYRVKRRILDGIAGTIGAQFHLPLEQAARREMTPAMVLADLEAADLVIADLSLERPSCYFEAGLAQALGKHVVLIAAAGTDIHQVFDRDQVEFYQDADHFQRLLTKIIQPVLAVGTRPL